MNTYLSLAATESWYIAGWTMIHFLWLGTLFSIVAMLLRLLLHQATPNVRYATVLGAFVLLAAMPAGIAAWLMQYSAPTQVGAEGGFVDQAQHLASSDAATPRIIELNTLETTPTPPPPRAATSDSSSFSSQQVVRDTLGADALLTLQSCIPYLPWLWLMGTPFTFALLALGTVGTKRLRRASVSIGDGPIVEHLSRLTASLRVTRRVSIAVCNRIAAPVLVGILRPIVLLPPAALTGWSPDEIEMVLLHELAHVRRWDNLVNLVQRIVESLLFFHPAVWLVSSWVRREREACCDTIVVAHTARPQAYAELLVALAAQPSPSGREPNSTEPSPFGRGQGEGALPTRRNRLADPASSAMAAGPLRSRIRRILDLEDDPMLISGKSFKLMLAALLTAATLAVLYLPIVGQAEESTAEVAENAESDLNAASELTQKNLKRLVMALHNNLANRGRLPANAIYNDNGRPLLSWRVHVLPFLAEEKLYREFHLDEPWDSKHNRKLIARMPEVFKNPKISERGKTNYLAVVGEECAFTGTNAGLKIADFVDGTSKTVAIVETDEVLAVDWTKPQDWVFDRQHPTRGLGSLWGDHWYGAWVDGSVRRVENKEPSDAVGIWFTRAGREIDGLKESEGRSAASIEADQTESPDEARFARFEKSLGEIPLVVVLFNGSSKYYRPLQDRYDELVRQGKMIYLWGMDVNVTSKAAERYGITATPTLIVFHDGKETHRLEEIESVAQLREFIAHALPLPAGARFPTLEDQKLADSIWRRLRVELQSLNEKDLQRVRALGYDGGVLVNVGLHLTGPGEYGQIQYGDILVGLHVWPTTSLQDVVDVLRRDDLAELNPLKFYVVRAVAKPDLAGEMQGAVISDDTVITGRMNAAVASSPPAPTSASSASPPDAVRNNSPSNPPQRPAMAEETSPPKVLQAAEEFRARQNARRAQFVEREAAAAAAKETPILLYDGRTFDEWRNEWRTELSVEKRLEAVKALAAFGRAGYGEEAAEAILEVVKQYDWGRYNRDAIDDSPTGELKMAMISVFRGSVEPHIPASDALSLLAAAVRAGELINFSEYVLSGLVGNEDIIPILVDMSRDEGLRAVRQVTLRRLQMAYQGRPDPRIAERMIDALSENSESAHIALRALYKSTNPQFMGGMRIPRGSFEARMRPKLQYRAELVDLLNRGDNALSEEVVEVFGLLGAKARPALPSLYPLLLDADLGLEALFAIRRITGSDQPIKEYLDEIIADGASPEQVEQARARLSELKGERVLEGEAIEKSEGKRESLQQD